MLNILEKRTWNPKVSLVSSLNNTGFEEVKKIFLEHQKFIKTTKSGKEKRYIRQKEEIKLIFNEMLKTLIESNFKERINNEIIEDIINRKIDPYSVAETLINEIIK